MQAPKWPHLHLVNRLLLLSTFIAYALAFVPSPKGFTKKKIESLGASLRYKSATGICNLTSISAPDRPLNLTSFSGYADVSPSKHVFFLFFAADHPNPEELPLTVWINGGPGSSSMRGAFQEHGPCMITADGKVERNPWSWHQASNMLYIDQPVTTGFSYTTPVDGYIDPDTLTVVQLEKSRSGKSRCPPWAPAACGTYSDWNLSLVPNSTYAAAPDFWTTIQAFLHIFPKYGQKGVHLATESYGGRYVPVFADYILKKNSESRECILNGTVPSAPSIPLESIIIGNGWSTPSIQYPSYYHFAVTPGNTYDLRPLSRRRELELYNAIYGEGNCADLLKECNEPFGTSRSDFEKIRHMNSAVCAAATRFCFLHAEYLIDLYANRNEYDIRHLTPDPLPPSGYIEYLNRPEIQEILGAVVNFTDSSDLAAAAFESTGDDARDMGIIEMTASLLRSGIRVVHYAGDADYICNWLGCEAVVDRIAGLYNRGRFEKAHYVNMTTAGLEKRWGGDSKESGLLSFTRVFGAGHEVPFYQPAAALTLFGRAVRGVDIATGRVRIRRGTHTTRREVVAEGTDPKRSEYRQGGSSVQNRVLPPMAVWNRTTGRLETEVYKSSSLSVKHVVTRLYNLAWPSRWRPKPGAVVSKVETG